MALGRSTATNIAPHWCPDTHQPAYAGSGPDIGSKYRCFPETGADIQAEGHQNQPRSAPSGAAGIVCRFAAHCQRKCSLSGRLSSCQPRFFNGRQTRPSAGPASVFHRHPRPAKAVQQPDLVIRIQIVKSGAARPARHGGAGFWLKWRNAHPLHVLHTFSIDP